MKKKLSKGYNNLIISLLLGYIPIKFHTEIINKINQMINDEDLKLNALRPNINPQLDK